MQTNASEDKAATRPSFKQRLLRIAIGVFVGLGVVAGGLLLLIRTLGEPDALYEGKPSYVWLAQIKSKDPALSNSANLVLNRTIIPQLTRDMVQDTNDSRIRMELIDYLNNLPHVNIYYRRAETRRADAVNLLGEFGPAAAAATPALLKASQGKDRAIRAAAARALGAIHADPATAVPFLIKYLDDESLNQAAALALAGFGAQAKAAVPKLLELAKVPDKDLHQVVMRALSRIDRAAAAQAEGK